MEFIDLKLIDLESFIVCRAVTHTLCNVLISRHVVIQTKNYFIGNNVYNSLVDMTACVYVINTSSGKHLFLHKYQD